MTCIPATKLTETVALHPQSFFHLMNISVVLCIQCYIGKCLFNGLNLMKTEAMNVSTHLVAFTIPEFSPTFQNRFCQESLK